MSYIHEQMARDLQTYTLPTETLALARSRCPFDGIDEASVVELITLVQQCPGKMGRLTTAIREHNGERQHFPDVGMVIEAHLDCQALPRDLLNAAVALGFEPDHFAEFVPDVYPDHLTFKVVTDVDPQRHVRMVTQAVDRLIHVLQGRQDFAGYLELEVYKTAWRTIIPFRPHDETSLPLAADTLQTIACLPPGSFKQADIHVKTPTPARGIPAELTDGPTMTALRRDLLAAGFYQVLTEAGNRVYTAQFIDHAEGRRVYDQLVAHFLKHGGIVDIVFEPCLFFWKSRADTPIPPLVHLR